jgi:hypothetical protein
VFAGGRWEEGFWPWLPDAGVGVVDELVVVVVPEELLGELLVVVDPEPEVEVEVEVVVELEELGVDVVVVVVVVVGTGTLGVGDGVHDSLSDAITPLTGSPICEIGVPGGTFTLNV